jgi:hypothetical protein
LPCSHDQRGTIFKTGASYGRATGDHKIGGCVQRNRDKAEDEKLSGDGQRRIDELRDKCEKEGRCLWEAR